MKASLRAWVALLVTAGAVLTGMPAAADSVPPYSATVTITDKGFQPAAVVVAPGGSVTWTNQGTVVHAVTAGAGALLPFTAGGLGPGQTATLSFGAAGNYYYSSPTDCLNGNYRAAFDCATAFMVIVSTSMDAANQTLASLAGPTPTPTATAVPGPVYSANVRIDDRGMSPRALTVYLGGYVWLVNAGYNVHTATFPSFAGFSGWDSGGLSTGQGGKFVASQLGTFTFTSEPDCLDGNHNPPFDCGPYTVTVIPPPAS